ncbi:MAG: zinc ribbon domain-containing protein [Kiritimatiellia bacterium]
MAKAIEQLLALQACDQDVRRLRKEMEDIPLRKQQIESRLGAHQEGLAQAEHALLAAKASIKSLEGEIEEGRRQIQKYREQQLQIKSNDGYKALEKEIATAQAGIRKLEDRELEAMEAVETAAAEAQSRRDSLGKEQKRVEEEIKAFLDRSAGLDGELKAKEADRKAQAAEIEPKWLARYERLFAKQKDAAIALVEHGTCGSCHMKLSPSQIVEARKPDSPTLCDFCGRMLYLGP